MTGEIQKEKDKGLAETAYEKKREKKNLKKQKAIGLSGEDRGKDIRKETKVWVRMKRGSATEDSKKRLLFHLIPLGLPVL